MSALAPSLPWSSGAGRRRWARRNGWTLGVCVLLCVLLLVEEFVIRHNLHKNMSSFEVQTIVVGGLPLAFAAMAQASVVIGGGIDLSVGALMSLVNVIAARSMVNMDLRGALLFSLVLIVGSALAGSLTGATVTLTRVPDIIVTLATSFIWAGVALQVMPIPGGGAPIAWENYMGGELSDAFTFLKGGLWTAVPSGLFVLFVVVVAVWAPFYLSRLGLTVYALGSNRNAAYLSGVSVARSRIVAYTLGGAFAALAGLALTASSFGTGNASSGASYTLNSIAAVVLGGVALTGGRGGMVGPIAAAFILQVISSILLFVGLDENYATVIQGVIVVGVVMLGGLLLVRRRT